MRLILRFLIISLSVWLTVQFFDGVEANTTAVILIVGACLTLFNMFVKPIIKVLTLPINILTLGIFSLFINGLVFWYIGKFVDGFEINTFMGAFWGAIVVSIINWILTKFFHFD